MFVFTPFTAKGIRNVSVSMPEECYVREQILTFLSRNAVYFFHFLSDEVREYKQRLCDTQKQNWGR